MLERRKSECDWLSATRRPPLPSATALVGPRKGCERSLSALKVDLTSIGRMAPEARARHARGEALDAVIVQVDEGEAAARKRRERARAAELAGRLAARPADRVAVLVSTRLHSCSFARTALRHVEHTAAQRTTAAYSRNSNIRFTQSASIRMGGSGATRRHSRRRLPRCPPAERPEAACFDFASRFVHGIKGETDGTRSVICGRSLVVWERPTLFNGARGDCRMPRGSVAQVGWCVTTSRDAEKNRIEPIA